MRHPGVAQARSEHSTDNREVGGSNPLVGTNFMEVKLEGRHTHDGPVELLDILTQFLRRINYKPGWVWRLNIVAQDMVMIGVHFPIIDVITKAPTVLIYFHKEPLYVYDAGGLITKDGYLLHLAHRIIKAAEEHERDEWFTFDGVKIFDPHANEQKRA